MARFGEVVVAMVTPFDDDGALDLDAAQDLARWLVERGTEGLVLAGTTGESPTLSDDEAIDLFTAVRDAVDVPLLGGTSSNDTAHSVELTGRAVATGLDGILAVTPYYSRPSQAGIEAHVRAVADAAGDLPVLLYDIPFRTGRKVETETIAALAENVANVVGVKDAAGDPAETARLMARVPDDFELYSGEDALNLPLLAVGAVGVVSVAAHWSAAQHAAMIAAFRDGKPDEARRINTTLLESYSFESGADTPNPMPTKAMLRALGLSVGQCRLPVGPAPAGLEQRALQVHERLHGS